MQALVELVALVRREHLFARQLGPQRLVASHDLLARLVGVEVRRETDLGLDVEQLADDVRLRDLEVVAALALGETAVQLAGLGVHEVRGERAGVAAEERVRERAVAPEEAAQVQPSEELDERVQQVGAQVGDPAPGEQRAVGQRELEMPRDEDRVHVRAAAGDDADRLDDRQVLALEAPQERPLPPSGPLGQLLERIQDTVVLDEAHHVAADAADQADEPLRLPGLERFVPRQVEEVGVAGAGHELEGLGCHRVTVESS